MPRKHRVLVAIDLVSRADAPIARANAIAEGLGAELLLLHIVDLRSSARAIGRRRTRARLILDEHARRLQVQGSDVQVSVRSARRPYEAIASVASEWDADLIVLGSYRRHLGDGLRGTTAERLSATAQRPVLVVNRDAAASYERVLLTSDLSRMSLGVARVAKQLGVLGRARISVVHAIAPTRGVMLYLAGVGDDEASSYQRTLRELTYHSLETQLARAGLDAARLAIHAPQAPPLQAIEQVAKRIDSDLLVVGSSRFPLLKRVFMGSVSNEVLRALDVDILLISPAAVRRARRMETSTIAPHLALPLRTRALPGPRPRRTAPGQA